MHAVGITRGAYHFARPDLSSAADEADWFLRVVGDCAPTDLLALDLEVGGGNLANWALTWLQIVEQRTGCRPFLYSGRWFMEPHGLCTAALARYPLWLAAYQDDLPDPPAPWQAIAIWQYSDRGSVPGIAGPVDRNRMFI